MPLGGAQLGLPVYWVLDKHALDFLVGRPWPSAPGSQRVKKKAGDAFPTPPPEHMEAQSDPWKMGDRLLALQTHKHQPENPAGWSFTHSRRLFQVLVST